jgi:hypothetical protein
LATVYTWGNFSVTGHASVEIEGDYFSFHPKNRSFVQDVIGTPAYLAKIEVDLQGGARPTSKTVVGWLDEQKMAAHINSLDAEIKDKKL